MRVVEVKIADRAPVKFEIAERDDDQLYFVLGIRKCGSSIMNAMLNSLTKINDRQFVDVAGRFFEASMTVQEWRNNPALLEILAPGNVYAGFRAMPLGFEQAPAYKAGRKILLVRDPRDALVSEYFSLAYSHSVPKSAEGAEGAREQLLRDRQAALAAELADFVLTRAKSMNRTFIEYRGAAADPQTKLFKYEDAIMNKRAWLAAIAAHFGWDGGAPGFVEGMMSWADKVPDAEDPKAFVRKVVPGDHKAKLSPAVIEQLNEALAPAMKLFGYS